MNKALFALIAMVIGVIGAADLAASSKPLAILMPGAGGAVPIDFLVRNRSRFGTAGIKTVVITSPDRAVKTAISESQRTKVFIVGMSRGALHAASAIAAGAPVSGAVFVSANYKSVISRLGSAQVLPPTLSVHHAKDQCKYTRPQGAKRFVNWSGGKARLKLVHSTGKAKGNPCGPHGAHGFFLKDAEAVKSIIGFILSH